MEEVSRSLPRRRWYQFSLREILLATVAIAAVVALFANNAPYSPTDFFQSLDEHRLLVSIHRKLGLRPGVSGHTNSVEIGPKRSTRSLDWDYINLSADDMYQKLMPELRRRIELLLDETGCDITERSLMGDGSDHGMLKGEPIVVPKVLREFSYTYSKGKVQGAIRVWGVHTANGNVRIILLTDEW